MANHDSKILSDWLPMGAGRTTMETFRLALQEELDLLGYPDDYRARDAAHGGRRDSTSCDRITITQPGGWAITHDGSATIKARGCTFYRLAVRRLAPEIAATMNLTYNGITPLAARIPQR